MYETIALFPIKFDGLDDIDALILAYYDVEFTADFGEFKTGDKFQILDINYEDGIIEAYDDEGDLVVKSQKFTCVPVE